MAHQVTISGAAKVATTKKEFLELKAAQAKSDIREKFEGGIGEVDPEVLTDTRLLIWFSKNLVLKPGPRLSLFRPKYVSHTPPPSPTLRQASSSGD